MGIKESGIKTIKTATSHLLTAGAITSLGLLSYSGMLGFSPSIPLAVAAFALAGFVEGEVFRQNIKKGIDDVALLFNNNGLEKLIIQTLDLELNPKHFKPKEACPFLQLYFTQRKLVTEFRDCEDSDLSEEQQEAKLKAQEKLHWMKQFFIQHVLLDENNKDPKSELIDDQFRTLVQNARQQLPDMKRKVQWLKIGAAAAVIAGLGTFFNTISSLGEALAITSTGLILPLAMIAGLGYTFMIFHTTKDILYNETITKWQERLAKWYKRNENENSFRYHARTSSIKLLIALTAGLAFATSLATAGTWWLAVKGGINMLPTVARFANTWSLIIVPIVTINNFIFSLRNSLQSIKFLVKQARRDKSHEETHHHAKETKNPIRSFIKLIELPYNIAVFIGHAIAVGLTSARTSGWEIFSLVVGTLTDLFTDMHYLFESLFDHRHEHGSHEPHQHKKRRRHCDQSNHHTNTHKQHTHGRHKPHKPDEEHHDHGTIPNHFLNIILTITGILPLAAAWDSYQKKISFAAAFKKIWNAHEHDKHRAPVIARNSDGNQPWNNHEIRLRFAAEMARLKAENDSIAPKKVLALDAILKQILPPPKSPIKTKINIDKNLLDDINTPRFFPTGETRTTKFLRQIEKDFELKLTAV